MPAEFGFHQMRGQQFTGKIYFVKGWHHLTFPELSQMPTFFTRWASRVLLRQDIKLGDFLELFNNVFGQLSMLDQNM